MKINKIPQKVLTNNVYYGRLYMSTKVEQMCGGIFNVDGKY
mgnify:CR=1 FL=1